MNMPDPPCATPYSSHNKSLLKAVKEVASEAMSDTAQEITELKGTDADKLQIMGSLVMGHGTACQLLNGCVVAILLM